MNIWPKRDEQGRHVTATGERYIIGECGGPEVVERARADFEEDLGTVKCKKCYDCGYIPDEDSGYANQCDCGAHELQ